MASPSAVAQAAAGARERGFRAADLLLPLSLCALALGTRATFRYRAGAGDADAMVMAAAMARALRPGVTLAQAALYGRQFSPGIYLIFSIVSPALTLQPGQVLPVLNAGSILVASALPWPLYALGRRWFTPAVSAAAVLLVTFAPLVWEVGTSFHPAVLSLLLVCLALLCAARASRSPNGAIATFLTCAAAALAVLVRPEVVLLGPALAYAAVHSVHRRRDLGLLLAASALAGALMLWTIRRLNPDAPGASAGLWRYARDFAQSYFRLRPLRRTLPWSVLAMGVGTVAVVGVDLLGRRGRADAAKARGSLGVAFLWTFVPLAFWLPTPVPVMRHFLLCVPGLAWLLAQLRLYRLSPRALAVTTGTMLLVNLLVPELIHAGAARARSATPPWPHGTFFAHHRRQEARIARTQRLIDTLEAQTAAAPPGPPQAGAADPARCPPLVQVEWADYGLVLLWLASATPPWEPCVQAGERGEPSPQCFQWGARRLRLLAATAEFDRPAIQAALADADRERSAVLVSRETVATLGLVAGARSSLQVY